MDQTNSAILFADIEDFTPLSERLASFDIMYLLNKYFDFAGNIVMRIGGEINNYIGDAFLAIFGLDAEGYETFRAVKAGLELRSELEDFANTVEENFDKDLKSGLASILAKSSLEYWDVKALKD